MPALVMKQPIALGIVGLGGYATGMCRQLLALNRQNDALICLAGACDPQPDLHPKLLEELSELSIPVFRSIDELLKQPVDAVYLPVPIHLHRPFTERALAAGKAVMCEKPAAGAVDDLDAMITARNQTGKPAVIGFQDIYDPHMHQLKRRLLEGQIGRIESATLWACWPRGRQYYSRNDWAGAFKRNGTWVMDSPANNALAHYINLVLFLLGPDMPTSATPTAIEAELYRVNPIENYDTCSLRITTAAGQKFLVLLTHASAERHDPIMTIFGTNGSVQLHSTNHAIVRLAGDEQTLPLGRSSRVDMFHGFARHVLGDAEQIVATLEGARAHLVSINGASEAVGVTTIPEPHVRVVADKPDDPVRTIVGIESLLAECARRQSMIHESRLVPWSQPAGEKSLQGYAHFAGPRG